MNRSYTLRAAVPASCLAIAGALYGDMPTPPWLRPPRLAVMTGFLKDPEVPGSLEDWAAGVGMQADAQEWVSAMAEAGVSYLIFYDKWHDGLVCHDTQTTAYETRRDLLRPVAAACHTTGLPLVVYWNGCYDNNPDFAGFVTLDAAGRPILFPGPWAMRLLSLHSPFRPQALEQVREIVRNYGPVAGLWLDCYSQPWPTTDAFTEEAFRARYGIASEQAGAEQPAEFLRTTLADYLRELRRAAGDLQPGVSFTINGSALAPLYTPLWAGELQSQLGFLSMEGHSFAAMEAQAVAAATLARPVETGDLISASWFSPPPPMAAGRARQALAEAAIAWCQGANVYLAITPDYGGGFGEELEVVRQAGEWLSRRRSLLADSEPWPDVGVILGAPSPTLPGLPSLQGLWGLPVPNQSGAWEAASGLLRELHALGYGGRVIYELGDMARWPQDLARFGTLIVPEQACLGPEHLARLRRYAETGGTLVVLGNGTRVAADGTLRPDFGLAEVLGVRSLGPAAFRPETGPVVCFADSEYGYGWVRGNLVDGGEAGWASADSPMPHWAQVNLPAEAPIAKVRVIARRGGYVLRDFDVLTWNGTGWDVAQTYAANPEPIVECVLEPPRTTLGVRVHVRAETAGGQERHLADIEEIEVVGPDGRVLSRNRPYPLDARGVDPSAGPLPSSTLTGPALIAEPTTASVLATFDDPRTGQPHPLVTRRATGRGTTVWIAVGETGLMASDWLPWIAQRFVGPPTVEPPSASARHRVVLRRLGSGLLLCVVDGTPGLPPEELELRMDPERLGLRGLLPHGPDRGAVAPEWLGRSLHLSVRADPAAVVLVR